MIRLMVTLQIHGPSGLPLYSILVTTLISVLLSLIYIGNSTAFNAIVGVSFAAWFTSYMIPIFLILVKRLRNDSSDKINWGPYQLGPILGPIANITALTYSAIVCFFGFWPGTATITPATMNWSCLIFGVMMLFSVGFYFTVGRSAYRWPIVDPTRRRQ
jgi:choline transport protein